VDGIVLEYNLGLLDGAVIASRIKQVRPTIPIAMVAEHAELPDGALQAVDVLVSTSDPPHFLWAAVHFMLNVKPAQAFDPLASALVTRKECSVFAERVARHPQRDHPVLITLARNFTPVSATCRIPGNKACGVE
jgi:hypothetical protein